MLSTIPQTVGVDISKLTLDVYLHPQAIARQFLNTDAGIRAMLAWLGQIGDHQGLWGVRGGAGPGAVRWSGAATVKAQARR